MKHSNLPIKTIQELHQLARQMVGEPENPKFDDRIVALIEYRDGTVIDTVRQLIPKSDDIFV